MRVMVYRTAEGVSRVTVVPAPRARLAPIEVQGPDRKAVLASAAAVVAELSEKGKADPSRAA